MVYVPSLGSKPLMPCTYAKARHLLEQGKAIRARISSHDVFVIRPQFSVAGYKEDIILGVDAGFEAIGLSASSERQEYFAAEVEVRNNITKLLTARREARRTRRNRLRYRAPRFVFGFKLWDKVEYNNQVCFISGRRSSGCFSLRTLYGTVISNSVSHKKLRLIEPVGTLLVDRRKPDSSPA